MVNYQRLEMEEPPLCYSVTIFPSQNVYINRKDFEAPLCSHTFLVCMLFLIRVDGCIHPGSQGGEIGPNNLQIVFLLIFLI